MSHDHPSVAKKGLIPVVKQLAFYDQSQGHWFLVYGLQSAHALCGWNAGFNYPR